MTEPEKRRSFLDWKAVVGVVLSFGLLYYALRDVDAEKVLQEIGRADPLIYIASVIFATLGFFVRAWRWRPLLKPVRAHIPYRPLFAATTIGFMANNLLPARVGEIVRCVALNRFEKIPLPAVIGSLVLERLFDGIVIVGFVFVALAFPGFPDTPAGVRLASLAGTLSIVFGGAIVLLMAMVIWPRRVVRFFEATVARILPHHLRDKVIAALEALLTGLSAVRSPTLLVQILLLSIVHWLIGAVAYWLGMLAFGIAVPFTGALFLQSLISLAVAIPSAPGFFGPFEAGVRVGLVDIWSVEINKAMGYAIGFHLGGFIPVTIIGLYYMWKMGLSLRAAAAEQPA